MSQIGKEIFGDKPRFILLSNYFLTVARMSFPQQTSQKLDIPLVEDIYCQVMKKSFQKPINIKRCFYPSGCQRYPNN